MLTLQTWYVPKLLGGYCYSGHGLNNKPFEEQTILDHLNTELVRFSDLHQIQGPIFLVTP